MINSLQVHPARGGPETEWPPEGLESLKRCAVCGCTGRAVLYRDLRDHLFFCAPGRWTMYRCLGCGVGYLDPRPTADTVSLAYSSYFFSERVPQRPPTGSITGARRFRRALAKRDRNRRYGMRERPASRLGIPAAYFFPAARRLLDLELRHLPRAWPGARVLDVGAGDGTFLRWAVAAASRGRLNPAQSEVLTIVAVRDA